VEGQNEQPGAPSKGSYSKAFLGPGARKVFPFPNSFLNWFFRIPLGKNRGAHLGFKKGFLKKGGLEIWVGLGRANGARAFQAILGGSRDLENGLGRVNPVVVVFSDCGAGNGRAR